MLRSRSALLCFSVCTLWILFCFTRPNLLYSNLVNIYMFSASTYITIMCGIWDVHCVVDYTWDSKLLGSEIRKQCLKDCGESLNLFK